ncbi:MAG: homocysteine S-methyltransferase, partial [Gemmatimonadaceae bacterium]
MTWEVLRRDAAPIVLDGGLATELERRGVDITGPLWSARALIEAPQAIEQLHRDYFAAGADCCTSASYQASYEGFQSLGLSHEEATRQIIRSVDLVCAARDRFHREHAGRQLFVAASVGPYGAMLHDGSEYHGRYGVSRNALNAFHAERLAVLSESGADVLACETIPSLEEASVLIELLEQHSTRDAWISFTSRDGEHTAHGEPLIDCARAIDRSENVMAVGVNCLRPTLVLGAIRNLRAATDKAIVVYPNSGEEWDA